MKFLTYVFSFLLIFFLLSGCGLSADLSRYEVTGVLLHSDTLTPISDAEVRVQVLSDASSRSGPIMGLDKSKTNSKGEFKLNGSGETVIFPDLFLSDDERQARLRSVRVYMSHPGYIDEIYTEELEVALTEVIKIDVGAFYLEERE
ncbi:MAG TPA: hypothetical protein PKA63_09310 [Oligoflexia bacterium]|nr:hypothetical protein [Oligoflexia bacterium]HMP48851.1 hypothetical protein [Oligoflexia bacterium]